jgi:hypothetical protein
MALAVVLASTIGSFAQCTKFDTVLYDDFEYTTVCPDIISSMVIHNTPQQFGFRSGARALYLNMKDCNGGTGCCAGDSIYIRTVSCCPNQPIRFRFWIKTIFTGTLSDIRVVLTDGNDNILQDIPSTIAPFTAWQQLTTNAVVPGTFIVKLKIYTNIDGQNGNDLGIDDMFIERCSNSSLTPVTACNNTPSIDLFSKIPGTPVNTGTWSGPAALGNGIQGTYTSGVSTPGTYIYTSTPYGTGGLCLPVTDSVVVSTGIAPAPNLGSDTSICINTPYILNPGTSGAGLTYSWSTFATSASITAFSGTVTNTTYIVTVSTTNGCVGRDSVLISWRSCTGINEIDRSAEVSMYPNPVKDFITVQLPADINNDCTFILLAADGKEVFRTIISKENNTATLPALSQGIYLYTLSDNSNFSAKGKIAIRN